MGRRVSRSRDAHNRIPIGGWIAFAGFAILFGIWSLATPLWSTPDAMHHDLTAYSYGHGHLKLKHTEEQTNGVNVNAVTPVPRGILESVRSAPCYTFHAENPASCIRPVGSERELAPFVNSAGRNFPVYYAVTGVISNLGSNAEAIYLERLVALCLAAWMMAWAVTGCLRLRRPGVAVVGVLLSLTPMLAYLGGAVNPNTLEITAAYAMVVCSLAYYADPDEPGSGAMFRRAMIAAAIVGSLRILGPAWLGVWAIGLLVVYGRQAITKAWASRSRLWMLLPVLGVAANMAWLTYSGVDNIRNEPLFALPFDERFRLAASHVNGSLVQMIGYFGWLDTPLPLNLWIAYPAALLFIVGTVWAVLQPRQVAAVVAVAALSWLLPVVLEAWKWNLQGPVWQGRYMLPTVGMVPIAVMVLAANASTGETNWNGRTARWSRIGVLVILAGLHLWAFAVLMRRNVYGVRASDDPAPWPPWRPPVDAGLLAGALALTMVVGIALVARLRMTRDETLTTVDASPCLATGAVDQDKVVGSVH